jgi:aminopeptidase N
MKVLKGLVLCLFAIFSCACAAPSDDDKNSDIVTYRLPNNSVPLRYDLWFKTDIDKGDFNFEGRAKIHVKTIESTKKITLHMKGLNIDKIDLLGVDGSLKQAELKFKLIENYDFLFVFLPTSTLEKEEIVLDIQYHGKLVPRSKGFTYMSYKNKQNTTSFFAAALLELVHARKAFPCFDEPQILSVINIKVQHSKSFNAIANMPITNRREVAGTDYVTSEFQDSFPMPTYLVSLLISDLKFISNNDTRLEQRVYGKQEAIDNGEGDLAFGVFGPFIKKLEDFFGIDFILKKVDHFCLDPFQIERRHFARQYEISNVAYELTQHHFGTLVTQNWPNLWLSKGISFFYANYLLSQMSSDEYYARKLQPPFDYSFTDDEPTLNSYAETPSEIEAKNKNSFNQRTAAIFNMFNQALTPETFTKGIKYYVTAMRFKTATPDDLHRELQRAFDEDYPENGVDIGEAMRTWEDQTGYPVIHVEKSGNKFILKQDKNKIFTIPLSYATKTYSKFDRELRKLWMKTQSMEIEAANDDDWLILNADSTGFFKVKYSPEIILSIIDAMINDQNLIPQRHRVKLFKEFTDLIADESLSMPAALKLFEYMKHDSDLSLWKSFSPLEQLFKKHLLGTNVYKKYEKFIQQLVKPHFDELGLESFYGELERNSEFRKTLVKLGGEYNEPDLLRIENEKLKKSLETNDTKGDFCNGMKTADEETYMKVLKVVEGVENSDSVYGYFESLGCSNDKTLLMIFLASMLKKGDMFFVSSFFGITRASDEGFEASVDFMLENFDAIKQQ